MAAASYALINELNLTPSEDDSCKHCPKIRVRVTRLCPAYNNPTKKHILSFVAMVLIDEKGNYIYAEIPSGVWPDLRTELIDNEIHILSRFRVIPNKNKFRVVNESQFMIQFIYDTYVKVIKEVDTIIPAHRFDFVKFSNIDNRRDDDSILTDLVGFFVNDYVKEKYFAIEIEDTGGQRVRVALWDSCIKDFTNQKEKHGTNGDPLIIALTSLRVKTFNSYTSISTSSSSRVYINLHTPEILELMGQFSGNSLPSLERTVTDVSTKDISSILEHCKTEYKHDLILYCVAEVKDIISERSWKYRSCTTCNTKPECDDGEFFCEKCQKKVEAQTLRYRIDLKVVDKDCSVIFVVFDEEAKKYIGLDAVSLYDESLLDKVKDGENYTRVPKRIHNTFVGKEFLFKIKVKAINHNLNKKNRLGIMEICDKNAKDVGDSTIAPKQSQALIEDDTDDDAPISQLSRRSKRNTNIKKPHSVIEVVPAAVQISQPDNNEKNDVGVSTIAPKRSQALIEDVPDDAAPISQLSKRSKRNTTIKKCRSVIEVVPAAVQISESDKHEEDDNDAPISQLSKRAKRNPTIKKCRSVIEVVPTDADVDQISQLPKKAERNTTLRKGKRKLKGGTSKIQAEKP